MYYIKFDNLVHASPTFVFELCVVSPETGKLQGGRDEINSL